MIRFAFSSMQAMSALAVCAALLAPLNAHASKMRLLSQHALVVDESSGQFLVEKNVNSVVPIASLTKLMTAMVVIDAKQDMNEEISIDSSDVDTIKHSRSRVPVGTTLSRRSLLHLALMSSENRAAASLARTYPGGLPAFHSAVRTKVRLLGMSKTEIQDPTGLSPLNTSTASDLAKMARAAAKYPEIAELSTDASKQFDINGKVLSYRNTNSFVGKDGWGILLSKTGYTKEAGRCIIMRMQAAGRRTLVVLLNANGPQARASDLASIKRHLIGENFVKASSKSVSSAPKARAVARKTKAKWRDPVLTRKWTKSAR